MPEAPQLPVIVIGAGPVGLAAAAHLLERGLTPLVLERGPRAGTSIREWAHVGLFSPWEYNIDAASKRLLERHGWTAPEPDVNPTGGELVAQYVQPLADTPELASHIRMGVRVVAVTRQGIDKMQTLGRTRHPLLVRVETATGIEDIPAAAVIDASGTWTTPNPLGANGLPAIGEEACVQHLVGGLPDVLGADRHRFAGKTTLVVGMGHSAANTLLSLVTLAETEPGTRIIWGIRGRSARRLYGGGSADELPTRGLLGTRLKAAVDTGQVTFLKDFTITRLTPQGNQVRIDAGSAQSVVADTIAAATGFRPDLVMLREMRLDLDPITEAPVKLGPLIDPNSHSCGTVPPHGAAVLAHPEPDFTIVGMKSYGRAPTFLLATGYEQVRSVAAAIAGDHEAATRVELTLPETGVCSTDGGSCEAPNQGLSTGIEHGKAADTAQASSCCAPSVSSTPTLIELRPTQSCCTPEPTNA
ncbi:MAG: FAD-dependent oxidoreductase [Actinomycetaceae bacterium]|nr:FAD-dependent oxidoreductase [Actinomycetaceae bacterium]